MYDDILVPTDGSTGAERGVDAALDLAAEHGARVHVLYVVDERVHGSTPALSDYELALERVAERGESVVEAACERARDRGLAATGTVRRGVPFEEIAAYATDRDVDLVVVGRHGRRPDDSHHLGSVTDRLLRTLETPVQAV